MSCEATTRTEQAQHPWHLSACQKSTFGVYIRDGDFDNTHTAS